VILHISIDRELIYYYILLSPPTKFHSTHGIQIKQPPRVSTTYFQPIHEGNKLSTIQKATPQSMPQIERNRSAINTLTPPTLVLKNNLSGKRGRKTP
jgi:hypothetical protein